jgi:hypothetical protein
MNYRAKSIRQPWASQAPARAVAAESDGPGALAGDLDRSGVPGCRQRRCDDAVQMGRDGRIEVTELVLEDHQ